MSTSRSAENIEDSVKDSIKMLYEDAPPNSIKRSMLYVYGADKIPVGVINSIKNISNGITNQSSSQINMSSSDESKLDYVLIDSFTEDYVSN